MNFRSSVRAKGPSLLSVHALLLTAVLAAPVAAVLAKVFAPGQGTWQHLAATVLAEYVANTVWLSLGVTASVVVTGVGTAWLITMCRFPGSRVLEWALVLPLAVPAYIMAYAYTDFLQFSGPLQTWIRDVSGWGPREYWFPDVRSLGGAIMLMGLVMYPYVYLLSRAAFLEQSDSMLEAARISGYNAWSTFFRVALPLARPGIVAGTALALMETLGDFGTVAYFGVPTFTTGIYRAWFSLSDPVAAAQLAAVLLGFVVLVLLLERWTRGRAKFHQTRGARRPIVKHRLHGVGAALATFFCLMPVTFGFLLPAAILARLAISSGDAQFGARYVELTFNSLVLAALTAGLAILLALPAAYAARASRNAVVTITHRIAGLGYAVPGMVIAVGVLVPLARFDNMIAGWWQSTFDASIGLILTGSIAALVFSYLVRFFSVAQQAIDAGLAKITPSMDDAARSLGLSPAATLARVHAPLLWRSGLTAGLLVFVEVMKELPATFVMRPFNFDTLAVQAFQLASDERLPEAATAALTIVVVGLLPMLVLSRTLIRSRRTGVAAIAPGQPVT